jgi:nucleoside-diphosphate-sugar epimerase
VAADYLKTYHQNWVNLIFPNIFGDSPRSVVDIFRKKKELVVYGDGLHVRDYVHVDDIVEALVKAKDWDKGEYSLGSNKGITTIELAMVTGKPFEMGPAMKEQDEAVIPNTSPNWAPTIDVLEYVKT